MSNCSTVRRIFSIIYAVILMITLMPIASATPPGLSKGTLFIDEEKVQPEQISQNTEIQDALASFRPIVLSNPSCAGIQALAGLGIEESKLANNKLAVIIRKPGEGFEITLLPEVDMERVEYIVEKQQQEVQPPVVGKSEGHCRWIVMEAKPRVLGDQGQVIAVGFQYDLNLVNDTRPARKYVTVTSIGAGISPGELEHNAQYHRGFFQDKVSVSLSSTPSSNWTGSDLCVEGLGCLKNWAWESITRVDGSRVGDAACGYEPINTCFSGSIEAIGRNTVKWIYWLNRSEDGKAVRRDHPEDLRTSFGKISEIPKLSQGFFRPDIQACYFTDGNQNGTVKMVATVEQHLVDLKSTVFSYDLNQLTHQYTQSVDIDFSKV